MHLHTQGGEIFRRNLQGKIVSALQAEQESIFITFLLGGAPGEIWSVGVLHLVVLTCVLRAATNERLSTF